MMQMLFRLQEVHIVGRHQRNPQFPPKSLRLPQHPPIASRQMLHLDVQPVPKNLLQPLKVTGD